MEFSNLLFEKRGKIALVTLNRPQALNALNSDTLGEINRALDIIETDAAVRGAIITGNGRAFVAGADISQMVAFDPVQSRSYHLLGQSVFSRIEAIEKPFIAAVNGFALGGGCELAMACDIRIASDKALFGQPETGLGIIPGFGATQRLPRLVGLGIARELLYTSRNVKPDEAKAIGLVNLVVPPESLIEESFKMMETILSKGNLAVGYAKAAVNKGTEMDIQKALELERDLISLLFSTEEQKERMRAFLEKRPPNIRD
ncbi:MAG: enoyl-CoA hydratase/isomerase family protein [Spirochaetaceae bacterium]|jgi:enoyl-CoA hydratase|nr:enoyl-CoA hydratase/isomerase family protein [Spirochaetaceae bacterium]